MDIIEFVYGYRLCVVLIIPRFGIVCAADRKMILLQDQVAQIGRFAVDRMIDTNIETAVAALIGIIVQAGIVRSFAVEVIR